MGLSPRAVSGKKKKKWEIPFVEIVEISA